MSLQNMDKVAQKAYKGRESQVFFEGGLPYGKGSIDPSPPPRYNRVSGKNIEGGVLNPGHWICNEG